MTNFFASSYKAFSELGVSPQAILDAQRVAARAVISAFPIPSPEVCDAEMRSILADV